MYHDSVSLPKVSFTPTIEACPKGALTALFAHLGNVWAYQCRRS
jgi:hypothetical protein